MSQPSRDKELQELLDFHQVSQVIYRYASTVDAKDRSPLRTLFVEVATAKYGDYPELTGVDVILDFIMTASEPREWLHHLLSVYHVDVNGDTAASLTYHTSHQIEPGGSVFGLIVARYRHRLRRVDGVWK